MVPCRGEGFSMDVSDDADRLQTLLYSSYSADVVRQLERPLLDDGVPLMRMAASAVARVTLSLLDDEDLDVEDARVTVLAGAGDNGGDGLYARVRRLPRLLLAVRCMRMRLGRLFVRVGVCWCWIRRLIFLGARLVFPRVRLVSGCRLRSSVRGVRMWCLML